MKNWIWYVRHGSLALVLVFALYLLWPSIVQLGLNITGREARGEEGVGDFDYVIKFSPGFQYMPGQTPYGIGDPLQGLADVIDDFQRMYAREEGLRVKVDTVTVPGRREYLVTQLSSGQAPDIINVNVEDVWIDIQKNWYIPLDEYLEAPNRWVHEKGDPTLPGYDQWWDMFKYQAISRGKAAPDNRNYCVSFDMVETGIYYNKDIFRELGLEPPDTFDEWLEQMDLIREADRIPLLMNIWNLNDWSVDLVFDQLYYELLPGIDLIQDPMREGYLEGYIDSDEAAFLFGKGFFTKDDPRYVELWRVLMDFRQRMNRNLTTLDPIREFVTQQGAMIWQASPFLYRLLADPELEFEWGVFYFPRITKETSELAAGVEACVIGGAGTQLEVTNTAIGDTPADMPFEERIAASDRLKVVIDFFQFIMLPENYERIVNEYPSFVPNVVGVDPLPELQPFVDILDRRYTTTKWDYTFDLRFSEIQRRMLELYVNDGIDLDGFMQWQTDNLAAAVENLLNRKEVPWEEMERRWEELAPVRERFGGLPTNE